MRKLVLVLLAATLVGAVAAPMPALALGGHGGGGSHSGHAGSHPGHGGFRHDHGFRGVHPGFGVGVLVVPPYAYYYPPALYGEPVPPMCYTIPGYWTQVPSTDATGYTTYYPQWVPEQTVCQ
jgi:hypothetical protein